MNPSTEPRQPRTMGLWPAVALAVGTMVGASIFSIFGLGARLAGQNLPLVFLVSALLSLLVAHSYAILGARIVSGAGPMEFILRGFGDGVITGALSHLFWLSYVISIALFARGFAGYLLPLLRVSAGPGDTALVSAAVVLSFLGLGVAGAAVVGRAESLIVVCKLAILGVFVALGLASIQPARLVPQFDLPALHGSFRATAVFFLSYMGFGLVTNASEHMRDPARNVPRAIYLSILVVTVVYVAVASVAVGNLPLPELSAAGENALARAAQPFLGHAGFVLVSVGALFSIASALNATLFGGANVAYALARDGELPQVFDRRLWFGANGGLYLTAFAGIGFAVLLDLQGIAAMTSIVIMVVYLFVLVSHWRLRTEYGGSAIVIAIGIAAVFAVLLGALAQQWQTSRASFWTVCALVSGSVLFEYVYRRVSGRGFSRRGAPGTGPASTGPQATCSSSAPT